MSRPWVAPEQAIPAIQAFLRHHLAEAGARGVVLGLSGGIDSALTARLARDALGPDAVTGVYLPGPSEGEAAAGEVRAYAESLGIGWRSIPLGPAVAGFDQMLPELADPIDRGNLRARLRMTTLYALARRSRSLVAGTGNKSELLLGYFTKHGDGAADLMPLGDLYKTEVRAVAEVLGLPPPIRARAPTAGFWEGQTDEGELGMPYPTLDRILRGLEELSTPEEIAEGAGLPLPSVRAIADRVERFRHKRRPAPIPKLGLRTIGTDWRD